MFQFQNLDELINRCINCSFCKQEREIDIDFGPEEFFHLDSFSFENNKLILNTIYRYSSVPEEELKDGEPRPHVKYEISFVISTLTNLYDTVIVGPTTEISTQIFGSKSKNPWPHFFIEGRCKTCNSYIVSKDIDLEFHNKHIKSVSLEKEKYNLYKTSSKYRIIYDYNQNEMIVQKMVQRIRKGHTVFIKQGKSVKLPLHMFDFSNEEKVISKLKTYITFS